MIVCLISIIWIKLEYALYNPISKYECTVLFQSVGKCKKDKSEDLIKLSIHGEFLDIFKYCTDNIVIGNNYPQFNAQWDGKIINNDCNVSLWKETPIHKEDSLFVYPIIGLSIDGKTSKLQHEISSLCNSDSGYYSYIITDSREYYFFAFSSKNNLLYYIRIKNLSL